MSSPEESLMREMTGSDYPVDVYSVSLIKKDHNTNFMAYGTLRGEDSRSYSATGETPEIALERLDQVLRSIICPTCGQEREIDDRS